MVDDTKKRADAIRGLFRENGMCGEFDRRGEHACALPPDHDPEGRGLGFSCDREVDEDYTNFVEVRVPTHDNGSRIDDEVIADAVREALRAGDVVALRHIYEELHKLGHAVLHGEPQYAAAIRLAGVAMRFAWHASTKGLR